MFEFVVVIHVIVCLMLIFIVILQSGRGADLGAAFGSVGQANFARHSMSAIAKITSGAAIVFMITSLSLAYLSSENSSSSILKDYKKVELPAALPTDPTPAATEATKATETTTPAVEKAPLEQTDATTPLNPAKP